MFNENALCNIAPVSVCYAEHRRLGAAAAAAEAGTSGDYTARGERLRLHGQRRESSLCSHRQRKYVY